jgi:hypothetical protein
MPNWCDNQITITGPNSVIDKIEKIVKEEKADKGLLNFMYPMPKELEDTEGMSKKPNWYDWRVDNWSTKWDINEFYGVDRKDDTISFAFSSAWAPPIGAYEHFLEKNEKCSLKAYYYEGGCDFAGLWEDGIDDCIAPSDFNSDDDYWKDGLGYDLAEQFNFLESMAEYEAEREAEKEDVTEYVKGKAINIGEEA